MEFGFLVDSDRELLSIGYRVADGPATAAVTTCWHPRRGSRASSPSPRAIAGKHWFLLGRQLTPVGRGSAWFPGRLHVRIPDAGAGDARARRQPARQTYG